MNDSKELTEEELRNVTAGIPIDNAILEKYIDDIKIHNKIEELTEEELIKVTAGRPLGEDEEEIKHSR